MNRFRRLRPRVILSGIILLGVFAFYLSPPVQSRIGWRVTEFIARLNYALSPPEQIVFVPEPQKVPSSQRSPTGFTPSEPFSLTATSTPAGTQFVSLPTATLTPIPQSIQLEGFKHEYQTWNNCGPATLAIALSYWGWKGDQRPIAAYTKPNPRDKNVMPYELSAYVENKTGFQIVVRVGGEIELLRRFLAAGLPVVVEKGFEGSEFDGWMGHYVLVTGYSDLDQQFTLQDSYYGPDQVMGTKDFEAYWRAFNFTYLVIYPSERQSELMAILDLQSDQQSNSRYAAQKATDEIEALLGRDQFYAWFNRGSNLVRLQDYASAAAAYDEAFARYPAIPEKERPWRIMWYQTGPYSAYYYSGRYQDVINLATTTLKAMSEPVLEESYYWRAMAREALGDAEGAVLDLRSTLKYHPGFEPAIIQLQRMGFSP